MADSPHGRFVWHEMLTVDKDATIDFYKEVIGWDAHKWDGGEQPYTMFTIGEAPVGGIMDLPEEARAVGAPPHWLAYISTPDTDATVEQAKELGDRPPIVVPPTVLVQPPPEAWGEGR